MVRSESQGAEAGGEPGEKRRKNLIFGCVLAGLFGLAIEVLAYWTGGALARVGVFYHADHAPEFAEANPYEDPLLGWPPKASPGDPLRDHSGARHSPDGPTDGSHCISVFGESLAFGNDVSDAEVWTHRLSDSLGCRIANFAVGGFGTDQTLLRYRQLASDRAPIVVIGVMPSGMLRNVTQWRPLTTPGTPRSMKPRFVVEADGRLRLVPLRVFDYEGYSAIRERPEDHLVEEYFVPNGLSGIRRLRFPFSLSLLGARDHWNLRAHFRGVPGHLDFYRPDHPAEGLELMARILEAFRDDARERGQRPLIVIQANLLDFKYRLAQGEWPYAPLVERLNALGVASIQLGEILLSEDEDLVAESLYLENSAGHFSPQGNEAAAKALLPLLRRALTGLDRPSGFLTAAASGPGL